MDRRISELIERIREGCRRMGIDDYWPRQLGYSMSNKALAEFWEMVAQASSDLAKIYKEDAEKDEQFLAGLDKRAKDLR